MLVSWIATGLLSNLAALFPFQVAAELKRFDERVLKGLSHWKPWEIIGVFISRSYPPVVPVKYHVGIGYAQFEPRQPGLWDLLSPNFYRDFPNHAYHGFKAVFDEMVSGGWAAWITTGMPAVCSLLAVAYVVTAEGAKHLIRLTHPFVLFLLSVFFLFLTVMVGTVFWLVAEFFTRVVVLIAHSLPQKNYVNQAPATTAVFALTWTQLIDCLNIAANDFVRYSSAGEQQS